jgi:hypothetical protein
MMSLLPVVTLLGSVHFVADFLLQSDWMALNKSKRFSALLAHVWVYTLVFTAAVWAVTGLLPALLFGILTFATHFITDAVTSRLTSKLWFIDIVPIGHNAGYDVTMKPTRHWFFVVIGLDQLIHLLTLTATWSLLFG